MRVAFFGSSEFSVPPLRALAASHHTLAGVIAQPDRPSGRNRKIHKGPVVEAAEALGVELLTPDRIGSPETRVILESWQLDVVIVASYGQYIPTTVLRIPVHGLVNIHPSLLPKYRGAAPLQWAIAHGEAVSGVTLFHVVKEMDAGDLLLQERHPILPGETAIQLSRRFSEIGARMTMTCLDMIAAGKMLGIPQDDSSATFAPKITLADAAIDWRRPAVEIENRIRGFQPWPGCFFLREGKRYKVGRAEVTDGEGKPGEILSMQRPGPVVMTGKRALRLLEIQPEGKKAMDGTAFLCGHSWPVGSIIEPVSQQSTEDFS